MKNVKIAFLIFLAFGSAKSAFSQSEPIKNKFKFIEVKGHTGSHFYTGQNLSTYLENGYASVELRLGWQSDEKHEWAKHYAYPAYGIGWYTGYIGDVEVFGAPNALYGFMSFNVSKQRRNSFIIEPALGLTYNLKPYNPASLVKNDAIGSKVTVYFNLSFGGKYEINRELDFLYGIDFTHFSNGRTVTPNYGLNMMGLNVGARYNFNKAQKAVDPSTHPKTILDARPTNLVNQKPRKLTENNIQFYQAVGTVQNDRDAGTSHRYITTSTVLEYQHKFNEMHGFTAGVDYFHDESLADTLSNNTYKKYNTVNLPAFHIGYDFAFWKFTVRMQVGTYLTEAGKDMKGAYFMRPNLKYDFSDRVYGQVGLKTLDGGAADWVEYGIGFKIFNK